MRELRGVLFLGRGPSPWHDDAIRAAAATVAGEEALTEDDVIRGLLADAYGFRHRLQSDEFSPYAEITRTAGAPPRQSDPLGPASLSLRAKVKQQAQAGEIEAAVAAARGIGNPYTRATALCAVAETQAQSGDIEGALATAHGIDDACERGEALGAVADAQAEAGDVEIAVANARSIPNTECRAQTLRAIAERQAEAGNIDKAVPIARGIEDAWERSFALGTIAARQAKASDIEEALATARSIDNDRRRAVTLSIVAEVQAEAGRHQRRAGNRPEHRRRDRADAGDEHHRRSAGGRRRYGRRTMTANTFRLTGRSPQAQGHRSRPRPSRGGHRGVARGRRNRMRRPSHPPEALPRAMDPRRDGRGDPHRPAVPPDLNRGQRYPPLQLGRTEHNRH